MAYRQQQYQQGPPNPHYGHVEASYNPPPQHGTNEYMYPSRQQNSDSNNRSYRVPGPLDANYLRSPNVDPTYDNSQWPEQNGSWGPETKQPYTSDREDSADDRYGPPILKGSRQEQSADQYGASSYTPGIPRRPDHQSSFDRPLPHRPGRQDASYQPRQPLYREEPLPNKRSVYNGGHPRADEYHTVKESMIASQANGNGHSNRYAPGGKPPSPFNQQQQSFPPQIRGAKGSGYSQDYRSDNIETPGQLHFAKSASRKPNKPGG
ncbi:MAG: hypothetical protein Q9201_004979 [Fulgogasparrea decipioides]